MSPRVRIAIAWLPAVAYTLLIWWLSSQALHVPLIEKVPLQDKGVHFIEYGALSLFITHAVATTWQQRGLGAVLAATLITAALGLLDELHQAFVPGRSSDAVDLLADSLGALVASAAYTIVVRHLLARRAASGAQASSREQARTRAAASESPLK